jgi:hypothetical protein
MKLLFVAGILLTWTCCSSPPMQPLEPAFFCWETTLHVSAEERSLQDSLGCKKLYVKILDIGRNAGSGEIEPYSRTDMSDSSGLKGLRIIPTVFTTNEVFQNISEEKIAWLAGKIAAVATEHGSFEELLFDCDWTPSTRDAFFSFLKQMRKKVPPVARISATIRLHQYKFPQKTGVPPVDRGMLMFYNTGDVDEESERNTVFHPDDALKYLEGAPKNYPIPLDLALPLFSWGLIFREGELWKIVPGPLPLEDMRSNGKWIENPLTDPFTAQLWELKDGTFLGGHYLRPGDHLRVSAISPALLFKAASLAQKLDLADDATLAFFHLNIAGSAHFSAQLLDSVCKTVRN